MSVDILSTLSFLIKLGLEIKARLDSLDQAAEDLGLLTANLRLLQGVFENPVNGDIVKANLSEFVSILDVLQSIANSCKECAKALDTDLAGAKSAAEKTKRVFKRIWNFGKIPELLAEIQRKAEQLQKIYSAVQAVLLQDIRAQQERATGKEIVKSTPSVGNSVLHGHLLSLDLNTDFASIDQLVGGLMEECKHLQQRLQETILSPDTSAVQQYQTLNPEGASFWRDRFQKDELGVSALRYETLYVSWARFLHEVETSFILKKIPTGIAEVGDIDVLRKQGSCYRVDQGGMRRLSTIRPLWLPALRFALDPLQKGYVKPQDYFNLLRDSSLSDALRKLALENSGYGILVECERDSGDLALPAIIESPADHVGWTSAQIVAVPTSEELGIITERDVLNSNSNSLFTALNDTSQDVRVYVRYLQTGQIERKSLSRQVRPVGGFSVGAVLSIRYEMESGGYAWSSDLHITEFKACYGGHYVITAGARTISSAVVFSTRPLKNSFDRMLRDDDDCSSSSIPELDCALLGSSKVFANPPKVGEKIQIEYDGFWYDARVTEVDGEEIEYVDWENQPMQGLNVITEVQEDSQGDDTDSGSFFFPDEQLTQLGKGTRRLWRPWARNRTNYDIRPYRCFHIGDTIEAPVMYPDFRFHYHVTNRSQLYFPARIVDVQGDQYVVEFSPALSVHGWWLGRMPKGEQVDLMPGSGIKVENPLDFNRMTISMDLVRPFSGGPRPVLGAQSAKPSGWSSFQGVRLSNLEQLLEESLWDNDHHGQRGQ
ncbi:hypothetical protein T069G_01563 [Trichoderma breve]|uniref:Uncharacterized protein n=1 Tax=Trichoderma breve TaxID=2034170 RepID=A0A9W9JRR2_9HYPO|nr:hypothetical protein T069G_01563 [Trichoderma breve]KAJ4865033.1 hypothetical protein T069G_01563 [Trichoderma breve]